MTVLLRIGRWLLLHTRMKHPDLGLTADTHAEHASGHALQHGTLPDWFSTDPRIALAPMVYAEGGVGSGV